MVRNGSEVFGTRSFGAPPLGGGRLRTSEPNYERTQEKDLENHPFHPSRSRLSVTDTHLLAASMPRHAPEETSPMTPAEIRSRYASLISPPMARWAQRALTCSHFREQELKHGELIAVRISQGKKWWEIDDLLREPLGQIQEKPRDPNVYFCGFGRWHIIQLANLPKVVDHLEARGVLNRLMVREIVDPAGCTHRRCQKLTPQSVAL